MITVFVTRAVQDHLIYVAERFREYFIRFQKKIFRTQKLKKKHVYWC